MDYDTFKRTFEAVLRDSRLPLQGLYGDETINLRGLSRRYSVRVTPYGGQDAEPFYVTAHLSWRWDAIEAARAATSEEDFLTQVVGREVAHEVESEPRRIRVDVELSATLTWGKPLPMPSPKAWAAWAKETLTRLEFIEPLTPDEIVIEDDDGRIREVLAWQSSPEATVICDPDGTLKLSDVSIAAGEIVRVPRAWSDSEHEPDADPAEQLEELFARVKASLSAWSQSLDHLSRKG
jgi:hypothetical protein